MAGRISSLIAVSIRKLLGGGRRLQTDKVDVEAKEKRKKKKQRKYIKKIHESLAIIITMKVLCSRELLYFRFMHMYEHSYH